MKQIFHFPEKWGYGTPGPTSGDTLRLCLCVCVDRRCRSPHPLGVRSRLELEGRRSTAALTSSTRQRSASPSHTVDAGAPSTWASFEASCSTTSAFTRWCSTWATIYRTSTVRRAPSPTVSRRALRHFSFQSSAYRAPSDRCDETTITDSCKWR